MDVFEAIRTRRSVRAYTDRPVEEEKIKRILESAFYAPSSRNSRPWHFVVVTDRGLIERLAAARPAVSFIRRAPLVIVVCADERKSTCWVEDASVAAENILLSATALGLGACWGHVRGRLRPDGSSAEDYVRSILGLPENVRVLCLIGIGYPAEGKTAHSPNEVDSSRIHLNRFGCCLP